MLGNWKWTVMDADKGGAGGNGQPTPEANPTVTPPDGSDKKFSQADVDQIVKERLEREKARSAAATEEARKKAEAEAAAKNGEWQKVAEQRESELKKLQVEAREKDIRFTALKLGMTDPDYGVFLVMKAGENADPDAVLKEYLAKNPAKPEGSQSAGAGGQGGTGTTTTNPTNPATGSQPVFSRAQLRDPVFYQANKAAILQAAKEGRIKNE
jgi:hypothetical protein